MKVLVTGGAGYIGSVVAAQLLQAGHDVVVLDNLSSGHADAVPSGAAFVEGDIDDAGDVLDTSYHAVLHFAAKSLVGESVARPQLYWWNNVVGTLRLLDAMREQGVRSLVFSSTAAAYGEPETTPIREGTPAAPINPYGQSKLAIDHALAGEATAHGLAAVSLRYFNVGGALGRYGERHDPETHLIPNVLAVPAGRRESVDVFGTDYPTHDGTAIRDYLHVEDLGRAHLLALDWTAQTARGQRGEHRVYNLGTGTGYTVRDVIDAARRVTGHPVPAIERERRPGDPPVLVASADRIATELGWHAAHDLDRIVTDAWAFMKGTDA
ncbi:UDP-glucose 4-epimerase GalE [Actinobacteria bacterium YIM 96077]|uniref:UDP-glucose 4-epimerase n=1 Tax=Phytoactinopolyspora halophila TaxID=1981511 RepID=A0A329QH05_9ACTN|nr:UDP-glucose 4-epimerase GalE [Phytoactinopolyspora halophila]AYY14463.1 UDP-glucose 4-epimerase GalE [Actinobacteria bacterium YIM 96077]RAW11456.1 UDP-glucose 4-epimerase GalE [Phytoactinopolyspora halophila]